MSLCAMCVCMHMCVCVPHTVVLYLIPVICFSEESSYPDTNDSCSDPSIPLTVRQTALLALLFGVVVSTSIILPCLVFFLLCVAFLLYSLCNSCIMYPSDVPNMYTHALVMARERGCTYQANHEGT